MKYIYVVNIGYDYEGQETVAVFSSLRDARKFHPGRGDTKRILKVKVDTDRVVEIQDPPVSPIHVKRRL